MKKLRKTEDLCKELSEELREELCGTVRDKVCKTVWGEVEMLKCSKHMCTLPVSTYIHTWAYLVASEGRGEMYVVCKFSAGF